MALLRKLKILDILDCPNIISCLLPRWLRVDWELKFLSQNIFLVQKHPATLSRSVGSKILSVCKGDSASTNLEFLVWVCPKLILVLLKLNSFLHYQKRMQLLLNIKWTFQKLNKKCHLLLIWIFLQQILKFEMRMVLWSKKVWSQEGKHQLLKYLWVTQNVQLKYIKPETQNLELLAVRENCQKVTLVLKWNFLGKKPPQVLLMKILFKNHVLNYPEKQLQLIWGTLKQESKEWIFQNKI